MKHALLLLAAVSTIAVAAPKAKPRAAKPAANTVAADASCMLSKIDADQRALLIKFFGEDETKQKEDAPAVGAVISASKQGCATVTWSARRAELATQAMMVSPAKDEHRASLASKGLDMAKVDAVFMGLPTVERSKMMGDEASRNKVVEKIFGLLQKRGVSVEQIEKAGAEEFGVYLGTLAAYDMAVRGASVQ